MLSLSIKEKGFISVGNAVVKVVEVRRNCVRLAIYVDREVPIHRFDPEGNCTLEKIPDNQKQQAIELAARIKGQYVLDPTKEATA
jgi:sRNA-binding carbon storage regulator CsrA